MNIEDFKRKQAELSAEIAEHGKAALLGGFRDLFAAHPELQAVRWEQCTPHFNDGDACTFGTCDFAFKADGFDPEGGDRDDGFHDYISDYRKSDEEKVALRPVIDLFNRINATSRQLRGSALEGIYLAAFGDHSRITVTRDLAVEVEEYEHD